VDGVPSVWSIDLWSIDALCTIWSIDVWSIDLWSIDVVSSRQDLLFKVMKHTGSPTKAELREVLLKDLQVPTIQPSVTMEQLFSSGIHRVKSGDQKQLYQLFKRMLIISPSRRMCLGGPGLRESLL